MFGFIKNWFKPKTEEVKKEYESEYFRETRAREIEYEILACLGGLSPDQEYCPPLIINRYKKLLEIANEESLVRATKIAIEESLVRATNYLGTFLTEQQQQDFMCKVSQLKEYKDWKLKKRINKLNEDF